MVAGLIGLHYRPTATGIRVEFRHFFDCPIEIPQANKTTKETGRKKRREREINEYKGVKYKEACMR